MSGDGVEGDPNAILDETSQSSVTKAKNYEMSMLDQIKQVTAETLLEYKSEDFISEQRKPATRRQLFS